jgi:hypothetical protein
MMTSRRDVQLNVYTVTYAEQDKQSGLHKNMRRII